MPYNENLADRAREIISLTHENVEEKKMFGGLCFLVYDKMLIGVEQDRLMVRIDPGRFDELLATGDCKPMDFTGKIMKGFVFVDNDVLKENRSLEYWIDLALQYNKIAKPSRKKK